MKGRQRGPGPRDGEGNADRLGGAGSGECLGFAKAAMIRRAMDEQHGVEGLGVGGGWWEKRAWSERGGEIIP